ncbi:MAG TPA: NADH-quinone oxidoreductase subunit L [Bacillota bacterium]
MLPYAWVIAALPLLACLAIIFFGRRFKNGGDFIGIAAIAISFVMSLLILAQMAAGAAPYRYTFTWLDIGGVQIPTGIAVDNLTALMLVVVTLVSLLVQIYSRGYMHGDVRYTRYYATLSFFTFSMLTLVLADNFLLLYVGWELVGLSSYLLIGHWFENPGPRYASMKAFITTRIGDVGLFLGILLLFLTTGVMGFPEVAAAVGAGKISGTLLTIAAVLVFSGAVGKSAQFPLHVWLPDAMEGPTPVSALIHAATMVAAGVYLVARAYGIFAASAQALLVVAWIGTITAVIAALIATLASDLKKVLAYSTISQLGYMMLGLGVGGYTAGVFHLTTHAFFKALLFLGSGSVIHAMHTQEMHEMGGLAKKMPTTTWTFIFGTLALAGIPPFAGFWSKDEILLTAWHSNPLIFWLALGVAFLTAYYMTRAVALTFFGRPRDHHKYEHAHESPANMTGPLVVLAVLALVAGLPGSPLFGNWFGRFIHFGEHEAEAAVPGVMAMAIGAAVFGILVGWVVYGTKVIDRRKVIKALHPVYVFLKNKMYFDEVYAYAVVGLTEAISAAAGWFDKNVVDGLVNLIGWIGALLGQVSGWFDRVAVDGLVNGVAALATGIGQRLRRWQTGYVQSYILTFFVTVIIGVIIYELIGG